MSRSRKRRRQRWVCSVKLPYDTREEAELKASRYVERGWEQLYPYTCPVCGKTHLTKRKPKKV